MSGEPNYLDRARRVLHDGLGDASKQEPNKPAMSVRAYEHKVSSHFVASSTMLVPDNLRPQSQWSEAAPGESLRNRIHQPLRRHSRS